MKHTQLYHPTDNPGAVVKKTVNNVEYTAVDLLPYKIKDRDRFYQRDHPKLEPDTFLWERYWGPFEKKCIEGTWVEDKGGTWVFMSPKLFFFINYNEIVDPDKSRIKPWLRDIEWIYSIYWLCCEGFSGFENDDKYTSHYLVRDYNLGKLDEFQKKLIPPSCYNKLGEFKEYVEPWHFLTRTYLLDDPRGPLGRPLYSPSAEQKNKPKTGLTDMLAKHNYLVLGARGTAKTQFFFQGVVFHEYTFSGVKFMEDIEQTARPSILGLVGGKGKQFQRSIDNIKNFYDSQPGQYDWDDGQERYWGPFYKNYQGGWKAGDSIQNLIKSGGSSGNLLHTGATLQTGVLQKDKIDVLSGGRVGIIGVEEVGQLGDLMPDFYSFVYDTMRALGKKIGQMGMIGTSGDLDNFEGIRDFWENPRGYEIYPQKNWWANPDHEIGLFISFIYTNRNYEDEEGNIYLEAALDAAIREYKYWDDEKDIATAASLKMNNPIEPKHMTVSNSASKYPKQAANSQLHDIDTHGLWETFALPGTFEFDQSQPYGVRFDRAPDDSKVITTLGVSAQRKDKKGMPVIFEMPKHRIPDNTYYVILDNTKPKNDDGGSYVGLMVYKHHNANGGHMQDNIACVWKGRYIDDFYKGYELAIKIAKFFNAKIWHETNVGGFEAWCRSNNYLHHLQPSHDPIGHEKNPYVTSNLTGYGYQLNKRNKPFAEDRFIKWLNEVKKRDPKTGVPTRRTINFIYSKMLLNEIKGHTKTGNFDLISCGWGLGLLLMSIEGINPDDYEEDKKRNDLIKFEDTIPDKYEVRQSTYSFENL